MNIYKKQHLLKSLFKATIVIMLGLCAICYEIGYHRGVSHFETHCNEICID